MINIFKFFIFTFLFFVSSNQNLISANITLSENKIEKLNDLKIKIVDTAALDEQLFEQEELISNIEDFVEVPSGGISWEVFGETGMNEYTVIDNDGVEWIGVRPIFKDDIVKLNGKSVLVQGYMFPLEQGNKQKLFLLGPFPATCPYHYHASSNLTIEVHAEKPILYSYEAVNIQGKLELVQKDDDYNIFFRLKDSEIVN